MSTPPKPPAAPRAPRTRSAFTAAFLSLIFPGLGHAYAGAWSRALAFAALPLLLIALAGGIFLRVDRFELLGFIVQPAVLTGVFVVNILILLYRIVAAIDAWNVARFLNDVDASGGGRLGRSKLPLSPLSIAGLLAVLIVIAGGHLAVAKYNVLAADLVNCVFTESEDATCDTPQDTPDPNATTTPGTTADASATPAPTEVPLETPIGSAVGTIAPELPAWDGKERLNILLVGVDQREGQSYFNTDTLIVASIDPKTNEVAMFQVPRDTVDVPVPANARNVWGSVYRGKINAWYANNRNRTDLWRGEKTQTRGFNALKALLGELYGLDIRYYVMVNFQGFRDAVNTLGGVQINVQIPVAESDYPGPGGGVTRIYIPAGPQHMSGPEALMYARSRHRAQGGDFDRGRRQQRVLVSLREQMNVGSIMENLTSLVKTLKQSVNTDIPVAEIPKLLSLADSVDTKNIRSYVFAPSFYATEATEAVRGYVIEPNVVRIRKAVKEAFSTPSDLLAQRERLGAEAARVWVLNASGRPGLSASSSDKLAYDGLDASAPNQHPSTLANTKIVVYNGAEASMPETVKYLEDLFKTKITTAVDPKVTVDMIITLGRNAPNLAIDPVG